MWRSLLLVPLEGGFACAALLRLACPLGVSTGGCVGGAPALLRGGVGCRGARALPCVALVLCVSPSASWLLVVVVVVVVCVPPAPPPRRSFSPALKAAVLRAFMMPSRRRLAIAESLLAKGLIKWVGGWSGVAATAAASESIEDCSRVPALPIGRRTRMTSPQVLRSSATRGS